MDTQDGSQGAKCGIHAVAIGEDIENLGVDHDDIRACSVPLRRRSARRPGEVVLRAHRVPVWVTLRRRVIPVHIVCVPLVSPVGR